MPTQRDPKRIIELLQAKANADGATKEEKEAIEDKINELREKYKIPVKEVPHTVYPSPFQRMTEQEFIDLFHATPRGMHTVVFPTGRGKTYFFQWLEEQMAQENPRGNEETWDLIDPNNPEY